MAREPYLPEKQIQRYEQMTPEALGQAISLLTGPEARDLFGNMLKSYRLAASVANTAWKFVKDAEKREGIPQEAFELLRTALSKYAPQHFNTPLLIRQAQCAVLEQVYNQLDLQRNAQNGPALEVLAHYIETIQQEMARG